MSYRWRTFIAALVTAVGVIVFALTAVRAVFYAPSTETIPAAAFEAAHTSPATHPARVRIPALGIDAKVEELGIVAGNRMQAPSNFTDIGWYKYGAVPGTRGTAVMYGHLDNGLGLSGVFKNLKDLKVGDDVFVQTQSGDVLHFQVTERVAYPYQEVPPSVLGQGAQSAASRISFITCSGTGIYDKTVGFTYDHRLVVTAGYVGETPSG